MELKLLGKVLKVAHFQKGNTRVVTRVHQKGTSLTIFDTSCIPYKKKQHQECLHGE